MISDLRESIAISWTVVIGPSSGTLTFRRRTRVCSLGFIRSPPPGIERSFSAVPFWPIAMAKTVSGSGLFRPAVIDNFSFAGNNWYLRGSAGWCILQTCFSLSSGGVSERYAMSGMDV